MDYTQLDIEHKRAFLMNLNCLSSCSVMLSEILQQPIETISEALLVEAELAVNNLTDVEVNKYVNEIEFHHKSQGGTLRIEK